MWTTEQPTEPGMYWFYGDSIVGQMGVDYTDNYKWEPRMYLVQVRKLLNGGYMCVTSGHFMQNRKFDKAKHLEGNLGYWMKAELPPIPFDSENFSGTV